MQQRQLGKFNVSAIGLGCMNLNHGYGTPPSPQQGRELLLKALDLGVTLFDTAALYGYGANESLVGDTLSPYRNQFILTSKCGLFHENGKRTIDGAQTPYDAPAKTALNAYVPTLLICITCTAGTKLSLLKIAWVPWPI